MFKFIKALNFQNFQLLWYNPKGSKCGKKAAGRIEYKCGNLAKKFCSDRKKNVTGSRSKKLDTDLEMVII